MAAPSPSPPPPSQIINSSTREHLVLVAAPSAHKDYGLVDGTLVADLAALKMRPEFLQQRALILKHKGPPIVHVLPDVTPSGQACELQINTPMRAQPPGAGLPSEGAAALRETPR